MVKSRMAKLFDRDVKTIGKHINNTLKEKLEDEVVVAKFATTTKHGTIEGKTQTKEVEYYNLDMIISVGSQVKSKNGIIFRKKTVKLIDIASRNLEGLDKADNFLYTWVKNHVFIDDNKRIAATLFIYFLQFYDIFYVNKKPMINNNTLASLTLLIVESNSKKR